MPLCCHQRQLQGGSAFVLFLKWVGGTAESFPQLLRMYLQRRRLESRSIEEVDIDPTLDVKVVDPEAWRAATS